MDDFCQHIHCNNMVEEYCREVGEDEYNADSVSDYINDRYCLDCSRHISNAPEDDTKYEAWNECDCSVFECPKIINLFSENQCQEGRKNNDKGRYERRGF